MIFNIQNISITKKLKYILKKKNITHIDCTYIYDNTQQSILMCSFVLPLPACI